MASGTNAERTIRAVVKALTVAGVPYMVTGSFASTFHGAPRSTQDVDVVIAPTRETLDGLLDQFPPSEYYASRELAFEALSNEGLFNVIDLRTGWKVDFIVRKSRPFSLTEFDRRRSAELLGTPLRIATAEDVLIAKLEWAKLGESSRQIEDAAGIIRTQGTELDLAYIRQWVDQLELQEQWASASHLSER